MYTINMLAQIKNDAEKNWCQQVIQKLQHANAAYDVVTFQRKTTSYNNTRASSKVKAQVRDNKRVLCINLGLLSNTTKTKNANCRYEPDLSDIDHIVAYATSDRVQQFFARYIKA